MMIMRKLGRPGRRALSGGGAAALAVALIAASASSAWAAKYNIKIAVTTPPGYSYNVGLEQFKKDVEEGSNGDIAVTIFPSAQMGNEVESGKNVQLGTLEMTVISASNISPFYDKLQVLSVPYLFKSLQCAYQVVDGPVGDDLGNTLLERSGIRVLSWYTFGMRQLFNTKRDVKTVEDLKGLKIRVPPSKMLELTWRTLGAIPTPLPFPEVFNGLQQGVIDGDANPLASVYQFKFYEPAKHVSLANVAVGMSPMLISEKFLKSLPENYQQLILEAGRNSAKVNREAEASTTIEAVEALKSHDVNIVEVDLEGFRNALGPVMEEAKKDFGADLVEKIASSQSGC